MSAQRFRINRPYVVKEDFDDEDVIVNLDTGSYYSLDKSGAVLWDLIDAGASRADIVANVSARCSDDDSGIQTVVDEFLSRLREEALIVPADDDGPEPRFVADESMASEPPSLSLPPVLTKYTDMQDMLLLDPVHDAGETGWPELRPESENT